jgi:hypothetical protein
VNITPRLSKPDAVDTGFTRPAGVTYFASEALLALLGSILATMLLLTCRPMIAQIHEEFVA